MGVVRRFAERVAGRSGPSFANLRSQACSKSQIDGARFAAVCDALDQRRLCHRKQWEWCYTVAALEERTMLQPGRRGLGFGVGTEPLTSYFAARGCDIVATDMPAQNPDHASWADTDQHARTLGQLNQHGLCAPEVLSRRVSFEPVDMTAVPEHLTDFDFVWSCCAMEHLGSLDAGADFVVRSMDCLKPGGVAVHTTEFNVSDGERTVEKGPTVAYRRSDLEELASRLGEQGHHVDLCFELGRTRADLHVDVVPFTNTHLRVMLDEYVITSFGLIVTAAI